MTSKCSISLAFALSIQIATASITVEPWHPIFKGIDQANGNAARDATTPRNQNVYAMRVDLLDPDIRFFTTPRNTNGTSETLGQNTSLFLKTYGLQAAVNANFYSPCCSSRPGDPMSVIGISVSTGQVVSAQESLTDSSMLLITKDNRPAIVDNNYPPQGTNGIWTAVAGHYAVLIGGVNLGFSTPEANSPNPRTAIGISEDRRYLILMTVDGRQAGSDGAVDSETADWLARFGAWDGLNLDGGGSSAMVKADCDGSPRQVNVPIDAGVPGKERVIANNFGVYAKPLPSYVDALVVSPYDTTATLTWRTDAPSSSVVEYGTTATYDNIVSDSRLLRNHAITLSGLSPGTTYYFRITANDTHQLECKLQTVNLSASNQTLLFDLAQSWKYATNNLDGQAWYLPQFNDASWFGPGPGLLYIESSFSVPAKRTGLPPNGGQQITGVPAAPTFYFRSHFTFAGNRATVNGLYFSNYVDDGAVFYLNGREIYRLRMPLAPAPISYTSLTLGGQTPSGGDATSPDLFSIMGNLLTNLFSGDNVLAAEVHQNTSSSPDIVFGSALRYGTSTQPKPTLAIMREGEAITIYWNGSGFTLQEADNPAGPWSDVPGPVTTSTFVPEPMSDLRFYSLRN